MPRPAVPQKHVLSPDAVSAHFEAINQKLLQIVAGEGTVASKINTASGHVPSSRLMYLEYILFWHAPAENCAVLASGYTLELAVQDFEKKVIQYQLSHTENAA